MSLTHPISIVAILVIAGLVFVVGLCFLGQFLMLYFQAILAGAPVGVAEIIGMRLRKADVTSIVFQRIRLHREGIEVSIDEIEQSDLYGVRIATAAAALIEAKRHGVRLTWSCVSRASSAGHDPLVGICTLLGQGETATFIPDPYAAHALVAVMREEGLRTHGLRLPDLEVPPEHS